MHLIKRNLRREPQTQPYMCPWGPTVSAHAHIDSLALSDSGGVKIERGCIVAAWESWERSEGLVMGNGGLKCQMSTGIIVLDSHQASHAESRLQACGIKESGCIPNRHPTFLLVHEGVWDVCSNAKMNIGLFQKFCETSRRSSLFFHMFTSRERIVLYYPGGRRELVIRSFCAVACGQWRCS